MTNTERVGRLGSIALDCTDPDVLAGFWATMVGGKITSSTSNFCAVDTGSLLVIAVRVPDHQPPTWPNGSIPKQFHIDIAVADLDEAQAAAVAAGATVAETQPQPGSWRVLLDPAGHPFCLTRLIAV